MLQTGLFALMFLSVLHSNGHAANPYNMGEVIFFERVDSSAQNNAVEQPMEWKDAPQEAVHLLNEPTKENARTFLKWQKEKIQRIVKAQEVMEQVMQENHEQ